MLPKIKKNLFKDTVKQVNSKFNLKIFLTSMLFAGTVASANIDLPNNTTSFDNIIKIEKEVNTLILQPSKTDIGSCSWHSSHSSHSSHYSHRSSSY